jgi:hypothetical protein
VVEDDEDSESCSDYRNCCRTSLMELVLLELSLEEEESDESPEPPWWP